uniref:K+ potassium transporter integral membrane domain-containing protein n=1 Tax=Quercus lobata TaxID=97700 RepID=A0A7N2LQM2_QUELO
MSKLEKSNFAKSLLLFATMLGTSMVIGDGVLTPCISVLSAVGGLQEATSKITDGCEALFADLGHFTVRSIQISMCCLTYPAIVLAYTGQAAFLRKNNELVGEAMYWPMFVVAVLAAIIASQAIISATFSIIQQSLSLGCFPHVKIVYTSAKYEGQVYIPEINYLLMLACVGVTLGFRTTAKIGNAYGIAVVFVMTLTSSFLVLIMIMIWKIHIIFAISYIVIIGALELLIITSVLYKFDQGGYLSLVFAAVLITIMFVWNNVFRWKYYYELEQKVSSNKLKEILDDTKFCRIPRLALFYSELVHGIPPIFKCYAANVPALHSVLIFVSIKTLPISKEPFEKILVERLKEFISDDFWLSQRMLNNGEEGGEVNDEMKQVEEIKEEEALSDNEDVKEVEEVKGQEVVKREIGEVDKAWNSEVVHLIGEGEVVVAKELV